jgi:hypothetical protein
VSALVVVLSALSSARVKGSYTIHGLANRMPDKALFLEPQAARSFDADLADSIQVSDMFRTPESSLLAVETGRGALAPAFSGHNFGKSIDIEVDLAKKTLGIPSKRALDEWMEARGWFCFWRDHRENGSEIWHYNYFGVGYQIDPTVHSTTAYLEAEIRKLYEPAFQAMLADANAQQSALAKLGLYGGEIDGVIGPQSKRALACFRKAWDLPVDGEIDYRTARTLAYVARETRVVPIPAAA